MEQDLNGENGVKEGSWAPHGKLGQNSNPKPRSGGPTGPSMAMKIPGKQVSKNQANLKKGRPPKNGNAGKDFPSTNQNHTNGNQSQTTMNANTGRDGRRPQKDERPMKRHTLPITQNSKPRSQNSSRTNSLSPVNSRKEENVDSEKMDEEVGSENDPGNTQTDLEVTTQGLKQLLSIGNPARIMYSRIQLLNISENPSSKHRPDCLERDFNASNGRWDPENWHRSHSSPPASAGERVRKFSFSDRDRFPDDPSQGTIVLGPQRRSFQDGCHVTSNSGPASRLSKLHAGSPTEPPGRHAGRPRLVIRQRSESVNEFDGGSSNNRDRQIESASALRTEEFDWDRDREIRRSDSRFRERDLSDLRPEPRGRGHRDLPRDLHELRSRDSDYRDKDYRDRDYRDRKFSHNSSRDFGSSGWYPPPRESRQRRYSNNEPEPEWYTAGPTSQFDTIELGGFEDETPADFSSWGGEIPMDDMDPNDKEKQKEKEREEQSEKDLEGEAKPTEAATATTKEDAVKENGEPSPEVQKSAAAENEQTDDAAIQELDFNDLLGIPGFSSAMEQILQEQAGSVPPPKDEVAAEKVPQGGNGALSSSSRFSQWFQREQVENLKREEGGSRGSTPHEELESLAEFAAERGLASPVDVESSQQIPIKNDIMRLLTQTKPGSGNASPSMKSEVLSLEQQELTRRLLLMQQVKSGAAMNVAELEAKAGARQSPQSPYGGVDMQNTEAFNRLVASIKEKDKIRQRQLLAQQQQAAMKFAEANQMQISQLSHPGRIPSPEELAAHTQNIFQQALIKKQLEKQKEAYKEKIRQIEQQRREEQLREAIRSADAKLQESKSMNKSLAFMPTSVMRKMQESREGKMQDSEMFSLQQQQQQQMMDGTHPDALASATASFSVKLANSGKKNAPPGGGNDLLARIYQSASQTKQDPNMGRGDNPGLRRNASFPDVLMDSKMNRNSAFHQPLRQNPAAVGLDLNKLNNESESARFRNLLAMSNEMQSANLLNKQLPKPPGVLKHQQSVPAGGVAADYYNNNMLKAETQGFAGKTGMEPQRKVSTDAADVSELKNQHEVALLTQAVLNKFGINEDQLSRLTPQQQQTVVSIVQEQYYHLQVQKQRLLMEKKGQKDPNNPPKLKQGDLPPPNASKNDLQGMINKNGGNSEQSEPRPNPMNGAPQAIPKSAAAQVSSAAGVKFTQQQLNAMPGVGAGMHGLLPSNPHVHPLQLRPLVPPPMAQFIPPPMARGMIPTTFIPQQPHIPGRLMGPPPPNVPLASHLGQPYQAAAFMQMQIYQQQQQQRAMLAAALQQQQMAQHQAQAYAAARQHQQNMKENSRGGNNEFSNPLERWFGREVLSQAQLPALHKPAPMIASDLERMNSTNQKQE